MRFERSLEDLYDAEFKMLEQMLEDCSNNHCTLLGGMASQSPKAYGIPALKEKGWVEFSTNPNRVGQYSLTESGKEMYQIVKGYRGL